MFPALGETEAVPIRRGYQILNADTTTAGAEEKTGKRLFDLLGSVL